MRKALIFGITGQDGSYLTELLLKKKYKVFGVKRRSSSINTGRLSHLLEAFSTDKLELLHGDITDTPSVFNVVKYSQPDLIFNLAAQSHVGVSFNEPEYTSQVDAIGTLRLLEVIKNYWPKAKLYQASTSELYGGLYKKKLNENTPFNPRSPYAAAKLYAYYIVKQYREAYKLNLYNGILFNHESPRRGENFVSRKITTEMNKVFSGKKQFISLGNLNAIRDWGHAKDYVEAMYIMLKKTKPSDYVIATGECYSVRDFCKKAFEATGHKIIFKGRGLDEFAYISGYCKTAKNFKKLKIGQKVINVDKKFYRPLDVPHLQGDSTLFFKKTGWKPNYNFEKLVYEMVESDIDHE